MPTYVCDTCEKAFDSKARLREHQETHTGEGTAWDPVGTLVRWKDFLFGLTLRQLAVLVGVVLMATLFAGTAFFYSTLAPSTGGSAGPVNVEETDPPTGQTLQRGDALPDVDQEQLPQGYVSRQQLSHDAQVYLLFRGGQRGQPATLLQYNCAFCPNLVENLTAVAQNFQGWVYVAPYRDMNRSIALTGPQRGPLFLDTFDRGQIESTICSWLRNQPIACAVGGGGNGSSG